MKSNIPVVVLARGGSKRIPLKNIYPICGKPLIRWVVDEAVKVVERVVVATDSEDIANTCKGISGVEIYNRATVADGETSAASMRGVAQGLGINTFALVQCTSPLLSSVDIFRALQLFETGLYDSVVSGVRQKRRRWMPPGWCEREMTELSVINGAIMVSSLDAIEKYNDIASGKCGFVEMPIDTYFEIDCPEELQIVELLLKKRLCIE